jgi:V-type H+-transporting ATPase subunit H
MSSQPDASSFAKGVTREKVITSFKSLPWATFVSTNAFITKAESEVLQATEEKYPHDVAIGGKAYVDALMKVVATINDGATQQYALTRIEDLLTGTYDAEGTFHAYNQKELLQHVKLFQDATGAVDTKTLLRVLRTDGADGYCKASASYSLARLIAMSEVSAEPLVQWIVDVLQSGSASPAGAAVVAAAALALTIIVQSGDARKLLVEHGGIGYLASALKVAQGGAGASPNSQLLYDLTFSMWALSFADANKPLFVSAGAVALLAEQVTAAPREKVIRVTLACLRNLCDDARPEHYETTSAVINLLIAYGLPKSLANFKERQWADGDIAADVDAVHAVLMANYRDLSTFDRWLSELNIGQLQWGSKLVHCEKFWRENAKELERNNFEALKKLIALLKSHSHETIAVACYDLGEFVRYFPNGKSMLKNLGAKDTIMLLVDFTDNLEVQRQALQCMSKIMVNQWEFIR